jgi:hypothetical protein
MKLGDYAPNAGAPYFIVAEGGVPNPHFTHSQPGARSLRNQLMYLPPRLMAAAKRPVRMIRDRFLGM